MIKQTIFPILLYNNTFFKDKSQCEPKLQAKLTPVILQRRYIQIPAICVMIHTSFIAEEFFMISLKLTNRKAFMKHLLLLETFDHFLFIEGEITTFNRFSIDGYLQKDFFEEDTPATEFAFWKQLREFCFSIIRGKQTPLNFKFIFSLSPENIAKLISQKQLTFQPEQVQGLYLNIRFNGNELQCVTGTSLKTFSMDKSLEQAWDTMIQNFFSQKEIEFELEI